MRVRVNVPILLIELEFELPQLHFVLSKQCALVHVLVDSRLVLDLLGPGRELKRRDGLAEALRGRRDHGHHGGFAVTPQGVLQETCEFGVSVRDVCSWALISEGRDDIT